MESASKTLKRVTLELGEKEAAICEDVNIEEVAPRSICRIHFGSFRTTGTNSAMRSLNLRSLTQDK